jgi:hypothetical protein
VVRIKGRSAWTFRGVNSGGIGIEIVAAEGGRISLGDPAGAPVNFLYGGAGLGLTEGFKLPDADIVKLLVKDNSVAGDLAHAVSPNAGSLYVLEGCSGADLTKADIQGVCLFVEVAASFLAGGSATAMLVGANPAWLAAFAVTPIAVPVAFVPAATMVGQIYTFAKLVASAKALLLIANASYGVQEGIGIAGYVGGLH